MAQLENIGAIERQLWSSADALRANSKYASNEYFLPVMGLIFLRHAYNRFLAATKEVEARLPTRGGVKRAATKEDYSRARAILLRERSQFAYLVGLDDSQDCAGAIIEAMELIEQDYENLRGVLPKAEYRDLENGVLRQMLRAFNNEALQQATGDVFGRIYEYFLTQFADQGAHDNGEFFTPVALVQMIVNVIEPEHGVVLDPACGSGGMFVQSAHFMEQRHQNPMQRVTFYGMEKNPTTIRLAKMNLAVHGLEGQIREAITYYEDPHELVGRADFVMANPPFNVDEVDAEKVKNDPRLPFGLPGTNKKERVSSGNYLWISYFYSYLNTQGRAGFVMSSQASSAGRDEAKVRQKLVETGAVEVMMAIRSNFFYTRTVPCELWFLDRGKPAERRGQVLMIDARGVYRKVTRKIYDFSPEQLQNLTSIVWLYRGQGERFLGLVANYLAQTVKEAEAAVGPLAQVESALGALLGRVAFLLASLPEGSAAQEPKREVEEGQARLASDGASFREQVVEVAQDWARAGRDNAGLHAACGTLASLAEASHDLVRLVDHVYKLAVRLVEACEAEPEETRRGVYNSREVRAARRDLDEAREVAVGLLKQVLYFHRQAGWLQERFPGAALRDVAGLVRVVAIEEMAANDWSLTPGRYVGVPAPAEADDLGFEEALREIHVELQDLNAAAVVLAERIARHFEELGV